MSVYGGVVERRFPASLVGNRRFFIFMSMFGSTNDGGAAAQEAQRQQNIALGQQKIDESFAGFDPKFYNNYANTVTGAEMPQLIKQYQTTGKNLTYALARGGNVNSSAGAQENQSLNNELGIQESAVANNAQNAVNTLKSNIQTQKGNLVNQLASSGDVSSTAEAANAQAAQDRAPSVIQPLGNLFADWSNTYLAGKTAQAFNGNGNNMWSSLLNQGYGSI